MMRGKFISLEGSEGVGKSTQVARLSDALRGAGKTVIVTREPGGTPGAESIRALLLNGPDDLWNPQTEALLFAAARADHVAKLILPALARGDWVLCDRYVDSTRAYQGAAGGISDAEIMALHGIGSAGFLPDRTLVLDLPVGEGQLRAQDRDAGAIDRMGRKPRDYYERVAAGFRAIAVDEPDRVRLINAGLSVDAVTAQLMQQLGDLL